MYYTPITDLATGLFIIIGGGLLTWFIIQLTIVPIKEARKHAKIETIEEAVIEKIAKAKGIDTASLEARDRVTHSKSFKRRMEEKAIVEFFGKE